MSRLKDFPSIHDRIHTGYSNALHSLYEIGRNLSDKERQEVIARVRAKGYRVEELEFYEYAPTDTMRHLFVTDGRRSGKHSLFYAGQRMLE
ncbi:MAG: hypothetical protein ACLUVG_02525 [Phocaeicola vulgatus]